MEKVVNILLVEDDTLDIIDIKRELDKINVMYNLHVAANGEEALEALQPQAGTEGFQPDVTLIDINMPKMNGLEFLAEVRRNEKLKGLKCFMMTTSSDTEDMESAKKLGISGYIVKPFKAANASMDAFNLMIDLMNV